MSANPTPTYRPKQCDNPAHEMLLPTGNVIHSEVKHRYDTAPTPKPADTQNAQGRDTDVPTNAQGESDIRQRLYDMFNRHYARKCTGTRHNPCPDVRTVEALLLQAKAEGARGLAEELQIITAPFLREPLHPVPMAEAIKVLGQIDARLNSLTKGTE
jgi:hypothetical protein